MTSKKFINIANFIYIIFFIFEVANINLKALSAVSLLISFCDKYRLVPVSYVIFF